MSLKFVILCAIVAASQASVIPAIPAGEVYFKAAEPYAHQFGYHVADPFRGNFHHHEQARLGDAVQGSYSLLESDGSRRIVDYTADGVHGFNAMVRHEPGLVTAVEPVPAAIAEVATPVITAPAIAASTYALPTAHAAILPPTVAPISPFFRFGNFYGAHHNLNCLYGRCLF